jgi:hypothetical protein
MYQPRRLNQTAVWCRYAVGVPTQLMQALQPVECLAQQARALQKQLEAKHARESKAKSRGEFIVDNLKELEALSSEAQQQLDRFDAAGPRRELEAQLRAQGAGGALIRGAAKRRS